MGIGRTALIRSDFAAATAATAFLLGGCGGDDGGPPTEPPTPTVVEVMVAPAIGTGTEDGVATIELGQMAAFTANARDESGDLLSTTFVWSSLEPSVATVDSLGQATSISPGETGIVAEAPNGVADTASLVVIDSIGELAAVSVVPDRDTVDVGAAVTFRAAAEDADGDSIATAAFAWSSLDPSVATVDTAGSATGVTPGEAGIVAASSAGPSDTATLVVEDTADADGGDGDGDGGDGGENQPPSAEILDPEDGAAFAEDETITFRGEASDPEDGGLPVASLVWESDRDGELGNGATVEASLTAGSHVISFTATDDDGTSDADTVSIEIEDLPDLEAAALELLTSGVLASAAADAELIVTNVGSEAGAFRWSVSEGGTELASGQRSGLAGGGRDTIPVSGLGPLPAGAHELVAEVDVDAAVEEVDEANNTTASRLESRPSGFDVELMFVGTVSEQLRDEVRAERDRWERAITGDLRDVNVGDSLDLTPCLVGGGPQIVRTEPIDDLLVLVRQVPIDSVGGVLAQAGTCGRRTTSADPGLPPLPYVSVMELDSADVEGLRSSGRLADVILHELGHALGFSGFLWDYQGGDNEGPHQLVDGTGADPRFVGPLAARRHLAVGGSGSGVPVETVGGSGTAGSHWRESVYGNEVMTGFSDFGPNPLSAVTIASFADMFYAVDLGEADAFSLSGAALKAAGGAELTGWERILELELDLDLEGRLELRGGSALPEEAPGER